MAVSIARCDCYIFAQEKRKPWHRRGDERFHGAPFSFPCREIDGRINGASNRHQEKDNGMTVIKPALDLSSMRMGSALSSTTAPGSLPMPPRVARPPHR